jgi:hypothetical protein
MTAASPRRDDDGWTGLVALIGFGRPTDPLLSLVLAQLSLRCEPVFLASTVFTATRLEALVRTPAIGV